MRKILLLAIIYLSFFIGFIITTIPWSHDLLALKPYWILALVMYWTANQAKLVGYITVLIVGIIFDSISGSALGEHAICYIIITFLNRRLLGLYKDINWGYKIIISFLLVFVYSVCYLILEIFSYNIVFFNTTFWLPIPLTVFIWLWINLAFNNLAHYFSKFNYSQLAK